METLKKIEIFLKKIEAWKNSINTCIHFIKKIDLNSEFSNLGEKYKQFIIKINKIELNDIFDNKWINQHEVQIILDGNIMNILHKYEKIYHFLKTYIHILLNPKTIHFLKNQKSFSHSNVVENFFLEITKYIFLSGIAYVQIQEMINNYKILFDNKFNNKFDKNVGLLYLMLYLNNINSKNITLNRKLKYQILNINVQSNSKSTDGIIIDLYTNNKNMAINDIQLIQYPIKPIISIDVVNYHEEVNHFSLKFPHSKFFTKYNVYPLIDKKYNESTVLSALTITLANRLKTIENIPYDITSKKSNIFGVSFANKFGVKISNNSFIRPAMFHKSVLTNLNTKKLNSNKYPKLTGGYSSEHSEHNSHSNEHSEHNRHNSKHSEYSGHNSHSSEYNEHSGHNSHSSRHNNGNNDNIDNWFPFGGINLYAKKYLSITENIILEKIKHDNLQLNQYFKDDIAQETVQPVLYNLDILLNSLLKEFKIHFQNMLQLLKTNNVKLEYMHLFMLTVGKEYLDNNYIATALKKIHFDKCKKYILDVQIINPHIDIQKFKKELKINQTLVMQTNGLDIWNSIKAIFFSKNFEPDLAILKPELLSKHILIQIKQIFTTVVEQKNALECIPNSLKLYGIIHNQ